MTSSQNPAASLHTSTLTSLPLLARGKVLDNHAAGNDRMLIVAIERISEEVDADSERAFWMHAQSSTLGTVWGDDDQLFVLQN